MVGRVTWVVSFSSSTGKLNPGKNCSQTSQIYQVQILSHVHFAIPVYSVINHGGIFHCGQF